jgi:hypothetical protein
MSPICLSHARRAIHDSGGNEDSKGKVHRTFISGSLTICASPCTQSGELGEASISSSGVGGGLERDDHDWKEGDEKEQRRKESVVLKGFGRESILPSTSQILWF